MKRPGALLLVCLVAASLACLGVPAQARPLGARFHEVPVPDAQQPLRITLGPDGNLWFTEYWASQIGRITPKGVITIFPLPPGAHNPDGITTGPDGALWFGTEDAIGRMTLDGSVTTYPLPIPGSKGEAITTGPDGNLWFTEFHGGRIGRITPAGVLTEFDIPTPPSD